MSEKTTRQPRADARRNHQHLVEVAHRVFTEHGPEAPLEEVARRAEVGIGTLYRHFPTRYDLLETVYAEQTNALIERADQLRRSLPPGDALFAWLREEAEHMVRYRALKMFLVAGAEGRPASGHNWKERLIQANGSLLRAAEAEGAVRSGLTGDDVLGLVHAVAVAAERADDPLKQVRTLMEIMTAGLRPPS